MPHALPDLALWGGTSPSHRTWYDLGSCQTSGVPLLLGREDQGQSCLIAAPASPHVLGGGVSSAICVHPRGKQNHHLSHCDLRGAGASTLLPGCTVRLFLGRPHRGAKSGHRQELPANTRLQRALPALGAVTVGNFPIPSLPLPPAPCTPALILGQHTFPSLFSFGFAPCCFIPAAKH